jgi:CheY-like chemotaxis protein
MGGDIGLESEAGTGSTFWIRLEVSLATPEDVSEVRSTPTSSTPDDASASAPEPDPPIEAIDPIRVLVAEDNAVNQTVVMRLLEKLNCVVDLAVNGQEAVDMASTGDYDMIFMDCQMPVMDGYQATGELRALESERARIPIVAMTAHAMAGDRERCLEAGMDDYIAKPLGERGLREVLERWRSGLRTERD